MATIVESIAGDRALRLGREELIRKFNFGSAWTQLRVGIWASVPAVAGITNGILSLGVCQGTTNGYRSPNTTDSLAVTFGATTGNWTYLATFPPAVRATGGIAIVQKISAGTVAATNVNGSAHMSAVALAPVFFVADFARRAQSSTSIRWTAFSPTSQAGITAGTAAVFDRYRAADSQLAWSLGSVFVPYVSSPGSQWATFNYAGSGLWDSVSISWSHDSPAIEINNLIVVRFHS